MIGDLGSFVAPRTLMGNILASNTDADIAMRAEIKQSSQKLIQIQAEHRTVMSQAQDQLIYLRDRSGSAAEQALVSSRKALRDARREIIETAGQTLPAYTDIVSRTDPEKKLSF